MSSDVVLLLGRKDQPTDAVEEYCRYLCQALGKRSVQGELVRVPWHERGWNGAIEELRKAAQSWRGRWVFLQYTALAWSGRGFSRRVPGILQIFRKAGARVGVVFHDVEPFAGTRAVDVLRRQMQLRIMRHMLRTADLAVFTVSLSVVSWLRPKAKAVFIPVGANLPEMQDGGDMTRHSGAIRIAVYGITGDSAGSEECSEIARA
ncbi:MAG: hypothetical protein JO260_08435, partial [Acidobacteria bacterium]|nr:hypothetical protein [Acidobacteriota bacterium]